ncbi:MAG: hypothetical protein R2911_22815 [Caldilineaceae bacterium]
MYYIDNEEQLEEMLSRPPAHVLTRRAVLRAICSSWVWAARWPTLARMARVR